MDSVRCTGSVYGLFRKERETFVFSRLNAIIRELITELGHRTLLDCVALRQKFHSCTRFVDTAM